MDRLLRIIGLFGIADGVLLALRPRVWSRRRGRLESGASERSALARVAAAVEIVIGLYLLLRRGSNSGERPSPVSPSSSSELLRHERVFVPWTLSRPLRVAFRLPVYLYRLGMGWLLGHRFLLLTHQGRRSGRVYRTVLEVVHYDPRTHESVVVSGWGSRSDWYRNIQAHPPLEVQTGRERYVPVHRELTPEEAYPLVVDYLRRLPGFARPAVRRLFASWGFSVEGPEEVQRAQAASLLMIAFRPQSEAG